MLSPEEQKLLKKLAGGFLDGMVGDEREYRQYHSVYCGKVIRDGIPVSYRQNAPSGFETERHENAFVTEEQKLAFLQRYGWLMDDEEARAYSARYKPQHKENESGLLSP